MPFKEIDNDLLRRAMERISRIQLPPHQLRALGLDRDWSKNVSEEYISKVLKIKEEYKEVFRELAKY
jgi:hypothetical protein